MDDSPDPKKFVPFTQADISAELQHVTQETYKKNFELAEKNKTLLLLRKIDEIVLSSATDLKQIAQQVLDLVAASEEFKGVTLYLPDKTKEVLKRIAVSRTQLIDSLLWELQHLLYVEEIKVNEEKNIIATCFREKKQQVTHEVSPLLIPYINEEEIKKIEEKKEIVSTLVYPFIVRGEAMGVIVLSIGEDERTLLPGKQALIERLVGVIGIAVDNTLLYQSIQEANERLKEIDKLKDEFVSLASHELRTPMTAIRSYLWMALEGKGGELSEKQKFYIQRSYASVEQLIKLVNNMLNVSRIESSRINIDVSQAELLLLVQDVIDTLTPRADELGIKLAFDRSFIPPPVLADQDKIKEVMFNLIGNALKFTPSGGVVTVSFKQKDDMAEVSVGDTGSGIAKENLSHLFQKFGILPGSYTTNQSSSMGTGLGLYICKSIIESHGGKIWVDSNGKGQGTTFTFSLQIFSDDSLKEFLQKHPGDRKQESMGLEHAQV